jgi:hypothetical protein
MPVPSSALVIDFLFMDVLTGSSNINSGVVRKVVCFSTNSFQIFGVVSYKCFMIAI